MKICLVFSAILALSITESLTGYVGPTQPNESGQSAARELGLAYSEYFYKYFKAFFDGNLRNFVYLPFGAFQAINTPRYGAKGNTAQQFDSVFPLPLDENVKNLGYQYNTAYLNRPNAEPNFTFHSTYFTSNGNYLQSKAQEDLSKYYGLEIKNQNFNDPQQNAQIVNQLASFYTNGVITEFASADRFKSFSAELVNFFNFDGKWVHKFNPESPKPFYYNENSSTNVPVFTLRDNFKYGTISQYNARYFKLPVQNPNDASLGWTIVFSNETKGLVEVVNNLKTINFSQLNESYGPATVTLPQFTFSFEYDAKTTFQKTGLYYPFGFAADFSDFAQSRLRIRYATQKSYLSFNEHGSQAASVFGLNFERTPTESETEPSQPGDSFAQPAYEPIPPTVAAHYPYDDNVSASVPVFNVNRPFLALYGNSKNIFFISVVNKL